MYKAHHNSLLYITGPKNLTDSITHGPFSATVPPYGSSLHTRKHFKRNNFFTLVVPCASLESTGFFTQLLIYLHTGVQVWYGLHGAGHVGLAASANLLDQHPAIHLHPAPQGTPGRPLPPHGALLPGLCTQGRVQGMYVQYKSQKNWTEVT